MRRLILAAAVVACAACSSPPSEPPHPPQLERPAPVTPKEDEDELPWAKLFSDSTEEQPVAIGLDKVKPVSVGSPAPFLLVDAWLRGEPVTTFERGTVYVIEFWATSDMASIQSFALLAKIQATGSGVVVVAVSSNERPPETGEPDLRMERLRLYVERHAAEMPFRVAYDGLRRTRKSWMLASGHKEVPCVFLVDRRGRIAWIGTPAELEPHVEAALAESLPEERK